MILAVWLAIARADDTEEEPKPARALADLPDEIPALDVPVPAGTLTGTQYSEAVYRGAAALKLDPAYVDSLVAGLQMIYRRDYKDAREHFVQVEAAHPGPGVDAFADILVWQALMFEDYNFTYDKQWIVASKHARAKLDAALAVPGDEAFEEFLYAGVVGIESLHMARKEQYLSAISVSFEAMDHVMKARAAAPDFVDLLLCDGMYNYWRTVITGESRFLPDFGDHRVEGVAQMQAVEKYGVFLSEPTTLALAFTWVEEGRLDLAALAGETNRAKYPDNVINDLMTGHTYVNLRKYATAIAIFDHVRVVAPENRMVHYYTGVAELRAGRYDDAQASLTTFLAFPSLEAWQQSYGLYRLGQLHYKLKRYDDADQDWAAAVKVDGNGPAKARLERLRAARKAGTLPT